LLVADRFVLILTSASVTKLLLEVICQQPVGTSRLTRKRTSVFGFSRSRQPTVGMKLCGYMPGHLPPFIRQPIFCQPVLRGSPDPGDCPSLRVARRST